MPESVLANTNLFLRYLTNDVPEQADTVHRLLQRASSGEIILLVNELVIAEIIWVLSSFYEYPRETIRDFILSVANTPGIQLASAELVGQAINIYVSKNIDYIDAYSICWMQAQGVSTAYTFDKRHFSRVPTITVKVPK